MSNRAAPFELNPISPASGASHRELLAFVARWKWLLVAVTAVAIGVAVVTSLLAPTLYEARATLLATPSKIPEAPGALPGLSQAPLMETHAEMIKSHTIAAEALREFRLDQAPHRLTSELVLKRIVLVAVQPRTNLITVTVRIWPAKLAADIANFVAGRAVRLNSELNNRDTLETREYIRQQRDQARRALEEAQAELKNYQRAVHVETLRVERNILLREKERSELNLLDFRRQLVVAESRLIELYGALAKQPPVLPLNKSVFADPLATAAVGSRLGGDLKTLSSITLKDETINATHQSAELGAQNLTVERAGLASFLGELQRSKPDMDSRLGSVETRIVDAEARLRELELKENLAKEGFALFAKKYEEASLSVGSKGTELKVVDPAIVPSAPLASRIWLRVAVAVVLGSLVGLFLAVFIEVIRSGQGRPRHPAEL